VGLNFTQFALASDIARAIKKGRYNISNSTDDMFFNIIVALFTLRGFIVKGEANLRGFKEFLFNRIGPDVGGSLSRRA